MATVFRNEIGQFISYDTYIDEGGSVEWIPRKGEIEPPQREDIYFGDEGEGMDYDYEDFGDYDPYP